MHGKTCPIDHDGSGVFAGLPSPFTADPLPFADRAPGRPARLPCRQRRAEDGTVQGFRHRALPIHGVQFHPESIASEHGHALLANFLRWAAAVRFLPPA